MRARNAEKGLGYLIARLRVELASSLDQQLAADSELGPLGLSAAQYAIIATLAAEDSKMCSAVVCERMSYDAGAMTRMLDRLEAKRLVRRQRCSQDRRRIYLELTEEARAALPRMREISRVVVNQLLHGFGAAEARELEGYLARMLQNAQLLGAQPAPYAAKKAAGARSPA